MEDEAGVQAAADVGFPVVPQPDPAPPAEPAPSPEPGADAEGAAAADAEADAVAGADLGPIGRHERRLRQLMGRTSSYPGPIVAVTRCWVSRDGALHVFAARFLDFAVLTPEYLMLCSTGFFTRRPRRRVFREPINRLVVIAKDTEPVRTLRVLGDFSHPLLFQVRNTQSGLEFARELYERTRTDPRRPEKPPEDTAS
jgi:hypothetical protein